MNKTFPWAIFIPQINSLSVSVRGELGLSGPGEGNQLDVLLSLSQEWTKMRNYRHKRDSISAQIYFTRYIGEEINQFIINFYVQIFQCILHNLYSHKKLKLNIQRSLLINICWGRVSQTRFMTFLITDNWVANDNDSTNHSYKLQARCDDLWFLIVGQMIACIII